MFDTYKPKEPMVSSNEHVKIKIITKWLSYHSWINNMQHAEDWLRVLTSIPPNLDAIISAVSKARCKSEEYITETLDSLDSLSPTSIGKLTGIRIMKA